MPESYRSLFHGAEDLVTSSEGWEPGALNLGQAFAMKFGSPLAHGEVTRLLIDLEKNGKDQWSEYSQKLSDDSKARLAERRSKAYRLQLHQRIEEFLKRHQSVLHVMVHTKPGIEGDLVMETPPDASLAESYVKSWLGHIEHNELSINHHTEAFISPLAQELSCAYSVNQYAQISLKVHEKIFMEGKPWNWMTLKSHLVESLFKSYQKINPGDAQECPLTGQRSSPAAAYNQ